MHDIQIVDGEESLDEIAQRMFAEGRAKPRWMPNAGVTIKSGSTPEQWQVILESDLEHGWKVRGVCVYRQGRVRLREVAFIPPDGEDTIADLKAEMRRLRLPWVARQWEYVLTQAKWAELPEEWRTGIRESPRPGRAGHPPAFYAEWVERYLSACEGPTPVASLAAAHPGVTPESIKRYLQKAEREGLIADRPGRGKAGGTMTDKCRRILAGEEA